MKISEIVEKYEYVAFTGSRHEEFSRGLIIAAAAAKGKRILVGDAAGVDAQIRTRLKKCEVFYAKDFGKGKGAFAQRSISMVRRAEKENAILIAIPGKPCPIGLADNPNPKKCFRGYGSGTWATAALAAGKGMAILIYKYKPPLNWTRPCLKIEDGWFWLEATDAERRNVQLSFFNEF